MVDYEEKYTCKEINNPVTKELDNCIQYNGSTILKLDSIKDCRTVCQELNRLDDVIEHYKSKSIDARNLTSNELEDLVESFKKGICDTFIYNSPDDVSLTQLIKTVLDLKALAIYSNRNSLSRNKLYTELTYLENQLMELTDINIELKRDWWEE